MSVRVVNNFLTRFYLSHLYTGTLSPAGTAALISFLLAVLVLVVNGRRQVNRVWAFALILITLWQGSIALAQSTHAVIFFRFAIYFGGCLTVPIFLLMETIIYPDRSFRKQVWATRYALGSMPLYFLVFTKGFLRTKATGVVALDSHYWAINLFVLGWAIFLLSRSIYLLINRNVTGIARAELNAYSILLISIVATAIVSFFVGRFFGIAYAVWLAPCITVFGLLFFTSLLVRSEIVDRQDVIQALFLFSARGIAYVLIGFLFISLICSIGVMTSGKIAVGSIIMAVVLSAATLIDRQSRILVDRRFVSRRFRNAQMAIDVLIERTYEANDVHAAAIQILQLWSDGSPDIFLSDGVFTAQWPSQPVPQQLSLMLSEQRWTTPEILELQGAEHNEARDYIVESEIGAIVCYVAQSGDKLMAAFKTRASQRPFVSRELREAHELLRAMQIGFSFVKLRQKLRGSDRLNFYSQYAPQFAHELRNGLYLQAQLLRAIADGRTAEVKQSDAKLGLEQVAQVDRLCEHFFNVGSLFNRPVSPLNVQEVLAAIVDRATVQYACAAQIEIELNSDVPPALHFCVNRDLFEVAVLNLIKNSVEVLEGTARPGRIEIAVSKHLEKIHFVIQDNGPGLPMDRRQDPFAPGLSRKRKGMGLGLAIVRDCIEAMGGTVGMRSSNDEGTCFEISLACAERLNGSAAPCGFIGVPT